MMDNLVTIFTHIAAKMLKVWLFIVLSGLLLCIISLVTAILLLISDISSGFSGEWQGDFAIIKGIAELFQLAFWDTLLLVTSIVIFPALYVVLANKIATQAAMYEVFKNHLSSWVDSRINDYLRILQTRQPDWMKHLTDGVSLKMKLLQVNNEDKTGLKIQRRVVKYFLNRLNLGEIDLQDKNLNMGQVLVNQINRSISELTEPSLQLFWLITLLHVILIVIAIWF